MAISSPSISHRCDHRRRAVPQAIALFLATLATAHAQTSTPPATATLQPVVVTATPSPAVADVTGFGNVPLKEVPVSATVIDSRQLEATGARRLADITKLDASVSDAYNAPGYWDFLSIRGFTLDNRFNYRREGLPISAETLIPLENKERIEILKGTSGIQAGTSTPGGLVNYVVKRPVDTNIREARFEFSQRASVLAAADLGGRFGMNNAFGWRLNVAYEHLRPQVHNLQGQRQLVALATEWRISPDSLLEAEAEWSHKRQGSQSGYSLLGNVLPAVPDPRRNLNDQPWLQPTVFDAATGTLRYTQTLSADWRWTAQLGTQRLKTDDYTAFPFGCGAEGDYSRFCSDGSFDYYDYRSVDERRRQDAASVELKGKLTTGAFTHDLAVGLLSSKVRDRLPANAFNWVGVGSIDTHVIVPSDPTLAYAGANRDERSLEFSVRDVIRSGERAALWLGLRHTRLDRQSVATDGTSATSHKQGITTPWVGFSYKLDAATTAYASWGEGIESQVVPNNSDIYANAGATLPALKSRQWEVGFKGGRDAFGWQLAYFDIHRPMSNIDFCSRNGIACTGAFDGDAHHRGLEASVQWAQGPWRVGGSATVLDAKRQGSTLDPAINGKRPQNVPAFIARAHASWRIAGVPGLELQGSVVHEGNRPVLADESVMLPAWTRVDAALRYETRMGAAAATWTLGVDNLGDRRYWKEAPYKFGHVYLYPGAPRTARIGFSIAL